MEFDDNETSKFSYILNNTWVGDAIMLLVTFSLCAVVLGGAFFCFAKHEAKNRANFVEYSDFKDICTMDTSSDKFVIETITSSVGKVYAVNVQDDGGMKREVFHSDEILIDKQENCEKPTFEIKHKYDKNVKILHIPTDTVEKEIIITQNDNNDDSTNWGLIYYAYAISQL